MASNAAHKYYSEIFHNAWRMSYDCSTVPPCGRAIMTKIKKEPSGGVSLDSYRSGTRAEYLARYALSRFCFVNQVPRQEDFGIADFFCTLGKRTESKKDGKAHFLIYPESSFYVQVKSNRLAYEINSRVIKWLSSHIANPFFICVVNQSSNKLYFYTPTFIWPALAWRPNSNGVSFFFDKDKFNHASKKGCTQLNEYIYLIGKGERAKYNIFLGEPIFEQSLTSLEKDKDEKAYHALKPHIIQEFKNIWTHRLIGPTITNHFVDNKKHTATYFTTDFKKIEESIYDSLITLIDHYVRYNQNMDKANALIMYLISLGFNARDILAGRNYSPELIMSVTSPNEEAPK